MQFRWCHVKNPFEKALRGRSFSREIFIALGSMCLERNAFFTRNEFGQATRSNYIPCGESVILSKPTLRVGASKFL